MVSKAKVQRAKAAKKAETSKAQETVAPKAETTAKRKPSVKVTIPKLGAKELEPLWPKGSRVRYTGKRVTGSVGQAGVVTGYREPNGLWVKLDSGETVSFAVRYAALETAAAPTKGRARKTA